MATHILGIRHHGPGSARNVKSFLEELKPDIVLVEGPPEADAILKWVTHEALKPPVAILAYQPDNIQQAVFYPFAEFSPEWQAISYAGKNNIHVRFMDLPMAHHFAIENEKIAGETVKEKQEPGDIGGINNYHIANNVVNDQEIAEVKNNPISWLAEAAGYDDAEKWWEHMFEHRSKNEAVFEAVNEAMGALREAFPKKDRIEELREAWMRKVIRQAQKEMFQNIAVICGAWHAPVLNDMPKQKEDNELLKALPRVKVDCTWIPWTYNRLSFFSGYGAGINSPGWYEHIWKHPKDDGTRWMAKVAKLFRKNQMDTSVAHVIEGVRLAEALASLRHLPKAGLEELNEATLSILCNGEPILLRLIEDELIVSNKIGQVPVEIPKPPLQLDIERHQRKLRLPPAADPKDYILDLRKDNDLERSIFLHRLQLLELNWGSKVDISGKGTFKEQWRLQWNPAFIIEIIEKGGWGNTLEKAATNYIIDRAEQAGSLQDVCGVLEITIPAVLPQAIGVLIRQINNLSAASGDVIQLMEVIAPLVNVSRYGNVRKTDALLVTGIITGMMTRICVSLPNACMAISPDAAEHLVDLFLKINDAANVMQQGEVMLQWQKALGQIAGNRNTAPGIAGYSTRLLCDHKLMAGEDLVKAFYFAMSNATEPVNAAAWLEGFLKGSGTLLLIDRDLWEVLDGWVKHLDDNTFKEVLPLLRRTFANFTASERRKLGEKLKQDRAGITTTKPLAGDFDHERAKKGIPVVMLLMGYTPG